MTGYPLDRNPLLVLSDQPVSLEWYVVDPDDPDKGGHTYRLRARCAVCGTELLGWAYLGWPDCDEEERDLLAGLAEEGCPHVDAMRTYLKLLLLESPADLCP